MDILFISQDAHKVAIMDLKHNLLKNSEVMLKTILLFEELRFIDWYGYIKKNTNIGTNMIPIWLLVDHQLLRGLLTHYRTSLDNFYDVLSTLTIVDIMNIRHCDTEMAISLSSNSPNDYYAGHHLKSIW